jgi:hypothetical protein
VNAITPEPIKVPLTYSDAVKLAQGALVAWRENERVDAAEYHIARALMAVDVASRKEAERVIASDLTDFLARLREFLDDIADVRDTGDGPAPDRAMQLLSELDGNDYERGLLERCKPLPVVVAFSADKCASDDYTPTAPRGSF